MVEGPGCKVKGERLKPRVKGQTVTGVLGNAVERHVKQRKKQASKDGDGFPSPFHALIGKQIVDIQTLGKEFFIFFENFDMALRIHWLMSGSYRLNQETLDGDWGKNPDIADSMQLNLSKDVVVFRKSCYHMRNAIECRDKVRSMLHLDICHSTFSAHRATELMMSHTDRMVTDVLLDQTVLPGVGNIIKNEALFDSSINPKTKMGELTKLHVAHLVKMTRDFSMIFYRCRRDNKPLHPHLKIYRKGKCKECSGKTVTTKIGADSERLTTYCALCQNNQMKTNMQLPIKNSLLGWVKSPTENAEWTCSQCTFLNKPTRSNCEMCLTPQHRLEPESKTIHVTKAVTDQNSGIDSTREVTVKAPLLKRKDVPEDTTEQPPVKRGRKANVPPLLPFKAIAENSLKCVEVLHKQAPTTVDKCTGATVSAGTAASRLFADPPLCPGHNKKCMYRQVHKAGENKGRMFWACTQKQQQSCQFFQWADERFPRCAGHDKIAVMRTVFKEGANNGKKFFACPLNKQKQCGFFQWMDEEVQLP